MISSSTYRPSGRLITIYLDHNTMDCRKWFMYLDDTKYKEFEERLIKFIRDNAPVLRMGIDNSE